MFCVHCGCENSDSAVFCMKCGARMRADENSTDSQLNGMESKNDPENQTDMRIKEKHRRVILLYLTLAIVIMLLVVIILVCMIALKKKKSEVSFTSVTMVEPIKPSQASTQENAESEAIDQKVDYSRYRSVLDSISMGVEMLGKETHNIYGANSYYCLYDINNDGVFELIINNNAGEIDDTYLFFTIKDNEPIYIGEIYSRYVSLSEKMGKLYTNCGHSGYQMTERIDFDGEKITTVTVSEGYVEGDYTIYGTAIKAYAIDDAEPIKKLYR